ncbi:MULTISPECIES: hypothetical protein [Pandoraea]|uniref:Ethyl tert-butyl ether degradation protein EthD n=1 Tax=Pandoraea capi TaxID=2508286 RepID=A0ABY6WDY3_9BURK|nr:MULTISPECIES: hypothetical protein [Pandoraea]ODP35631.1 hypothetical protein A9762_01120 [Pandoraea sp. ISTKB]VVE54419.1 hypothetical protein PCA20602_04938 [Pandoraea capi]
MLIRYAFFRGQIKAGREADFARHVQDKLVPLWTRFPGAKEVRILRQRHTDATDLNLPLGIAIRFDTQEDIDAALASPARLESQAESRKLMEMFDGTVFHTVFDAQEFVGPSD